MAGVMRWTDRKVAQFWDANAAGWSKVVDARADIFREAFNNPEFFRFAGNLKGLRILDAGCGEGRNTRLFALRGARMTGVDLSRKLIARARKAEREEPLGIVYREASFSRMPMLRSASFDGVVSTVALMDGPDFKGALRELFRVLKPGGPLSFSITHPCFEMPKLGWRKEDGQVMLAISDYFNRRTWVERWPDDISVPRFPRTLSWYLNAIIATGFLLEKLEEPRPSEAACRRHPKLRKWRDHAACYLYVRARKPDPAITATTGTWESG